MYSGASKDTQKLLLLDDWIALSKASDALVKAFNVGRHQNWSSFYIIQKWTTIDPKIRTSIDYVFLKRCNETREIKQLIRDSLSAEDGVCDRVFDLYNEVVQKIDGFLLLDRFTSELALKVRVGYEPLSAELMLRIWGPPPPSSPSTPPPSPPPAAPPVQRNQPSRPRPPNAPSHPQTLTTCLSYPGGKHHTKTLRLLRGIQQQYFRNTRHLFSPFCGGLSFELDCVDRRMKVSANDLCLPLIQFWRNLQSDKAGLIQAITREWDAFHESTDEDECKQRYHDLKASLEAAELDPIDAAAKFWVVHKRSFGQLGLAGGYYHWTTTNRPNFCPARFDSCGTLAQLDFTNLSYEAFLQSVPDQDGTLLFVDPPYRQVHSDGSLKNSPLYGIDGALHTPWHDEQKHIELKQLLCARSVPWMLIHEDNQFIRSLYSDHTILPVKVHYKGVELDEVIVLSIKPVPVDLALPVRVGADRWHIVHDEVRSPVPFKSDLANDIWRRAGQQDEVAWTTELRELKHTLTVDEWQHLFATLASRCMQTVQSLLNRNMVHEVRRSLYNALLNVQMGDLVHINLLYAHDWTGEFTQACAAEQVRGQTVLYLNSDPTELARTQDAWPLSRHIACPLDGTFDADSLPHASILTCTLPADHNDVLEMLLKPGRERQPPQCDRVGAAGRNRSAFHRSIPRARVLGAQ